MTVTSALCSACGRQVNIGEGQPLACPVCSSPLIEIAAAPGDASAPMVAGESHLLDVITGWIRRHHRDGGDFSVDAIAAAGEAGRNALRSGYSLQEAFDLARSAYFFSLGHLERDRDAMSGS